MDVNSWAILVNVGAILCVLATFASSLKSIWCFPIWIAANVILGACDLYSCFHGQPVYGRVALDVLQFAISIFGWWNWKQKEKQK